MTQVWKPERIDLPAAIRPGDAIVWGQACGEPQTLTEALVAQRAALGGVKVFMGASFSQTVQPEHADYLQISGLGGVGSGRRLTRAGVMAVRPLHISQVGPCIEQGLIGCDVVFLQLSRPNARGEYSYGLTADYIQAAVAKARTVIAESNDQVPFSYGTGVLRSVDMDFLVETSRPPLEVPSAPITELERAVARHIEAYIPDGATLQVGIGAIPDAVVAAVGNRRDLGVHSGMIGDSVVDLMERGVVTNARKPIDAGVTITGTLIGTRRLYAFADCNPAIGMRPPGYTHSQEVLLRLPALISLNSAVEVDLTGQVNAEEAGGDHVGAVGGQVDYVRGAVRSAGGHSFIALPASAQKGAVSRIVARLSGPVTTARSDVDIVVTEFGAAELRGRSLPERARALIAIAAPPFREGLEREAHALLKSLR